MPPTVKKKKVKAKGAKTKSTTSPVALNVASQPNLRNASVAAPNLPAVSVQSATTTAGSTQSTNVLSTVVTSSATTAQVNVNPPTVVSAVLNTASQSSCSNSVRQSSGNTMLRVNYVPTPLPLDNLHIIDACV